MDVFKGQNLLEFSDRFKTDEDCKEYLASIKAKSEYKCTRCNHTACQIRKDFARQCNICGHIESATADTLFHKVKFGVRKAFFICFEMATTTKSLSASYMAVRYGVTEKTARLFMHKVREAMASSGNDPMDGEVHVDEFVLGGKDEGKTGRSYDGKKKKAVTAVQLTREGKVKRMYAMKIDDFPARSLQYIFVNHISRQAQVTTKKNGTYTLTMQYENKASILPSYVEVFFAMEKLKIPLNFMGSDTQIDRKTMRNMNTKTGKVMLQITNYSINSLPLN